jgi:adenine-specific DNA-methyltransferase
MEYFLVRKTHPTIEIDALKDRAMKSEFDFIDFRAVDFDSHKGKPFEHNWQDFRTRKDRTLKTVSNFGYDRYPKKGRYRACVKVIDVFGCSPLPYGNLRGRK